MPAVKPRPSSICRRVDSFVFHVYFSQTEEELRNVEATEGKGGSMLFLSKHVFLNLKHKHDRTFYQVKVTFSSKHEEKKDLFNKEIQVEENN